jgi:hypothetical protein
MIRTFLGSALAVALLAGAGVAGEATFGEPGYYADANTPFDGNCPDGFGAHGFGLGKHGGFAAKHNRGGGGLAYASGYPNGKTNYGEFVSKWDYAGPGWGCRTCSNGECLYRFYGQPDLFYNYYAWPSCTGLGAELYLSPRPVPPHVGHTYITYQPLYPHEFLYDHHRTYHRYYNGGQGLNRTSVKWKASLWPSKWPANTCH